MNGLSEDDSSDDSSREYLVHPNEINLNSTFFKSPKRKSVTGTKSDQEDDTTDDEGFQDVTQEGSVELFSQVLQNLESTKTNVTDNSIKQESSLLLGSQSEEQSFTSANEISQLLLMGEAGTSSFKKDAEDSESDNNSDKDIPEYTIPKDGVKITLPGTSILLQKKKKGKVDPLVAVRRHFREIQLLVLKVSLLCWLGHGFHLNRLINEHEIMAVSLSLLASCNYPKSKADMPYLEKFTKWFNNMFALEAAPSFTCTNKKMLLNCARDKKVAHYTELVLLYIALVRAMGLQCRLVVSLYPPRRKIPENLMTKTEAKSNKMKEKLNLKDTTIKSSKHKHMEAPKEENIQKKIPVPLNSPEAKNNANLEARKRAATILKEKSQDRWKSGRNKTSQIADRNTEKSGAKAGDKTTAGEEVIEKKEIESVSGLRKLKSRKIANDPKEHKESTSMKLGGTVDNDKSDTGCVTQTKRYSTRARSKKVNSGQEDCTISKYYKSQDTESGSEHLPSKKRKGKAPIMDHGTTSKYYKKEDTSTSIEPMNEKKHTTRASAKNMTAKINSATSRHFKKEDSDSEEDFKPKTNRPPMKKDIKPNTLKDDEEYMDEDDIDSEEEFKPEIRKRVTKRKRNTEDKVDPDNKNKDKNRRILSSESDNSDEESTRKSENIWAEVYIDSEKSWIPVCVPEAKVNCISELYKRAKKPVLYVIAWNSEGLIKDVTKRYSPKWLTVTRKKRIDEKWWSAALVPWKEKDTAMSRTEDEMLLQKELDQPLPKTVGECKGHPLYVLTRHLLKFEGLYPPDCAPLGHLKTGEAIYSRFCVHTLRSRETWIKQARVVKPNQEAYKIVKSMPKYDKLSGMKIKDAPLELFGEWQTMEYIPPEAKDGKVPRNEYGNVDLFKQSMLPKGTVHINLPALNRVARKLNIDCAPAVVGFNFGCMGAVPAFEGFVVCEEYEDTLREAWEQEQREAAKRAKEKREKRVYGNWKRLIHGLFIREKLARKYEFEDHQKLAMKRSKQGKGEVKKTKGT